MIKITLATGLSPVSSLLRRSPAFPYHLRAATAITRPTAHKICANRCATQEEPPTRRFVIAVSLVFVLAAGVTGDDGYIVSAGVLAAFTSSAPPLPEKSDLLLPYSGR